MEVQLLFIVVLDAQLLEGPAVIKANFGLQFLSRPLLFIVFPVIDNVDHDHTLYVGNLLEVHEAALVAIHVLDVLREVCTV